MDEQSLKIIESLKTENEELKEEILNGFPVTKVEWEKINKWKKRHEKACHSKKGSFSMGGAIGGNYTYEFIPTGIGTIGTIRCCCGKEFCFRELE